MSKVARRPVRRDTGFTVVELLIAAALASLLLAGIAGIVDRSLDSQALIEERNALNAEASFAMQRMVRAVADAHQLILPLADNPLTIWRENVREETVPPSAPEPGSSKATAVLAVPLSAVFDIDRDGFPDADNDRDGRIDEDFPADIAFDYDPGIHLIDDDGNGQVDEGWFNDANDDEQATSNDDPINGVDDDGDGSIDEDPGQDMNGDGAPGIAGVDDDQDGQIDEEASADDDEDGQSDEDWLDPHVFYLQGSSLMERHPVPWDESANGTITGRDFIISTIAENVTLFRVERPPPAATGAQLVYLTLELTAPSGETVSLHTRVRVGAAL